MKFVVFDFDHTLFDADSGTKLVKWLIQRSRWRVLLAVLVAPLAAPLIAFIPTRRYGISVFVWIGTLGLHDEAEVNRTIDLYVDENISDLRKLFMPPALAQFNEHLAAGDTVIVATGAPTELARKLMREVTQEKIPVIGTILGPILGGMHAIQHCHNENKIVMMRALGYDAPIDIAYTDSFADLPLALAAAHPIIVNPKSSSVDDFRRALPAGTPIVWWGAHGRAGDRV